MLHLHWVFIPNTALCMHYCSVFMLIQLDILMEWAGEIREMEDVKVTGTIVKWQCKC